MLGPRMVNDAGASPSISYGKAERASKKGEDAAAAVLPGDDAP